MGDPFSHALLGGNQQLEYHDSDYREGQKREPEHRQSLQVWSQWRLAAARERMDATGCPLRFHACPRDLGG